MKKEKNQDFQISFQDMNLQTHFSLFCQTSPFAHSKFNHYILQGLCKKPPIHMTGSVQLWHSLRMRDGPVHGPPTISTWTSYYQYMGLLLPATMGHS